MDENNSELKILLSNLRSKQFEMEHAKLASAIQISSEKVNYHAGELILFDNHNVMGLVLQVFPDCLKVLLETNKFMVINQSRVSKKIMHK